MKGIHCRKTPFQILRVVVDIIGNYNEFGQSSVNEVNMPCSSMWNNLSLWFDIIISHVFYFLITFSIILIILSMFHHLLALPRKARILCVRFIIEYSLA
jgi:hypothetical protein